MSRLSIGEAAARSGLPASTIRYYEDQGLITTQRDGAGRRWFDDDDVGWLQFLHNMRSTGMSVPDLAHYAALRTSNAPDIATPVLEIMQRHERHLEQEIAHYQACLDLVQKKIQHYNQSIAAGHADMFDACQAEGYFSGREAPGTQECEFAAVAPSASQQAGSAAAKPTERSATKRPPKPRRN